MKFFFKLTVEKTARIFLNAIPVLVMIGLIPLVPDDYALSLAYIAIIALSFFFKKEKNDFKVLMFGLFVMTISESLFVSIGVETFNRISLFGLMPVWLPILWAYSFVAIKRGIEILDGPIIDRA